MIPEDGLHERFADAIDTLTPELYRQESARVVIGDLLTLARETATTTTLPGYGQVKWAVERELNETNIKFPTGKIYTLPTYDEYGTGDPAIEYESRILVVTNDKSNSTKNSKIARWFDGLFEEETRLSSNVAIIHTLTPKETKSIYTINSITFVAMQSTAGENYFLTLAKNEKKGEIIVEAAIVDEMGIVREKMGSVDTGSLKATTCDATVTSQMVEELKHAKEAITSRKEQEKPNKNENVETTNRSLGKRALAAARGLIPEKNSQ